MTTYSYAQLERLWINAGGDRSLAPLMAAIALAESHGNSDAKNPNDNNGTQTSWGLWQISNGTHSSVSPNWNSGPENAKLAVAKYQSQGLGAWGTYTSGAYKQFFHGQIPPAAHAGGGGAATTTGGGRGIQTTGFVRSASDAVKQTGALLHGTAVVLDRVFAMFAPGQGWRLAFGAGAAAAAFGSYKAFTAGSGQEDSHGELPLAIALLGIASLAAFMAMRSWPQSGGHPIKPGAYVVDVLKGEPPPAGPPAFSESEVQLTELGIGALVGLWAAGKIAQGASAIGSAAGGIGGLLGGILSWLGKLGGAGGGEPVPPVEGAAVAT